MKNHKLKLKHIIHVIQMHPKFCMVLYYNKAESAHLCYLMHISATLEGHLGHGVGIWETRLAFRLWGCQFLYIWDFGFVLHPVGCCVLGAGAACTRTSAATPTPAQPSICINLRLHFSHRILFHAHPDIFKVRNCGRVCPPASHLFPCLPACTSAPLHLCTQDSPQLRISPNKLTHLPSQMCTILPEMCGMCMYDIPQLCISATVVKLVQEEERVRGE